MNTAALRPPLSAVTLQLETDVSLPASVFLASAMLTMALAVVVISCKAFELLRRWRGRGKLKHRCSTPRARPSPRVSREKIIVDAEGETTPLRDDPSPFNRSLHCSMATLPEGLPPTSPLSTKSSPSMALPAGLMVDAPAPRRPSPILRPPSPPRRPPSPKMPPKPPPLWPLDGSPPKPRPQREFPTKPRKTELFLGLNGARLLASVHIVLGHLYQLNAISSIYCFSWGYTWVPWFFMLSGFVLTHTSLKAAVPRREGVVLFLTKRTATIYPLYAVGLGLALVMNWWRGRVLPEWYELLAQGFLVQAWLPWLPERTVQVHCWFLSALVPYWLLFDLILHRGVLKLGSLRTSSITLLLLALPPWLACIFPSVLPDGDANWYASHRTGKLDDATDFSVVLLKFHPASYIHVFVFGMVLARLRSLLSEQLRSRSPPPQAARYMERLLRFGATLGYVGLALVFTIEEIRPPSYKLSARLSVLMLLQGFVLIGLAPIALPTPDAGQARLRDPLEWLLSKSPVALGNIAYSQYILHFIAYALWPVKRLEDFGEVALFFLFLLSAAWLCSHLVVTPCSKSWRNSSPKTLLAVAIAVAAIGASSCAIDDYRRTSAIGIKSLGSAPQDACTRTSNAFVSPSPYVRVAEDSDGILLAVDVRLNWTTESSDFAQERDLINPNLLWSGGQLRRAARAHAIVRCVNSSGVYNGSVATEITYTWYSDLAMDLDSTGAADEGAWAQWNVSGWRLDGSAPLRRLTLHSANHEAWGPQVVERTQPTWHAQNRTLVRMMVSGAEDPKLMELPLSFGGGIGVAFSSLPPTSLEGVSGMPKYQMYQTFGAVVTMPESGGGQSYRAVAARLQCGLVGKHEKNWIPLAHGGRLHYVWAVFPHWVISANAQGECLPARYTSGDSAVTDALARLASAEGIELHGSGSAIDWSDENKLALFHTKDVRGQYVTFAYLMLSRPPFTVTNVSRPLPLQGGGRSFASSLSRVPGGTKVAVAYGVADVQSRVLIMSTEYLLSLFVWEEACSVPPPPIPRPGPVRIPPWLPGSDWFAIELSQECRDAGLKGRACSRSDRGLIAASCFLCLTLVGCCIFQCTRFVGCWCHCASCSAVLTARTKARATLRHPRRFAPTRASPAMVEIASIASAQVPFEVGDLHVQVDNELESLNI